MSARWLLDIAALAQASQAVVKKHAALRSQQLAVYGQTSALVVAVRSQTGKLTESTVSSQQSSPRTAQGPVQTISEQGQSLQVPSSQATHVQTGRTVKEEGLQQDHHYDASEKHIAIEPKPLGTLPVQQEQAQSQPLPDGTFLPLRNEQQEAIHDICSRSDGLYSADARKVQRDSDMQIPSQVTKDSPASNQTETKLQDGQQGVFNEPSKITDPILPSLPRVRMPKEMATAQESDQHVVGEQLNQDVFYSPTVRRLTDPSTQKAKMMGQAGGPSGGPSGEPSGELSEEAYAQIFQNPRIGSMLTGNGKNSTPHHNRAIVHQQQQWPPREPRVPVSDIQPPTTPAATAISDVEVQELAASVSEVAETEELIRTSISEEQGTHQMRESRVPSSRIGRIWQYAGLGASMTMGAAAESLRRLTGSSSQAGSSLMLNSANLERFVAKLSRMRGAALKLGQMISFQDSKMLPPAIHQVLQRVQDSADYMPAFQRNQVLEQNLGPKWRDLFSSFDEQPMAAASIGQVHGAVLRSNGERVVIKIQYPGVANSIDSDLNNLSILLTASRLLPKGLYLDKTIANARTELAWECDYIREAEAAQKFQALLADEPDIFAVPKIHTEASGKQVLTMQRMEGVAVTKIHNLTQGQKDWIGTQILRLCLRELTEFWFMQTDPNWTNFLFNKDTCKLELLDFGATRAYPETFIVPYTRILQAAAKEDEEACRELSIQLGYLTGMESKAMLDAHIASMITLAEPFKDASPDVYDFQDQTITDRVRSFIPIMLRERLAPPPEETYSLHRKLSGAFLLLAKLGAKVRCKELFASAMKKGFDR